MKYGFITLFIAACLLSFVESKDVKPLAKGNLDTNSGILSAAGECPPSLGGPNQEWCFVYTKCFDDSCAYSMSDNPEQPGADHGGMLFAIYETALCELSPAKQDTVFVWMRGRIKEGQKNCLDSLRAVVNSATQDTTDCHIAIYDGFTAASKAKLKKRDPLTDSLPEPITFWRYTCE